MDIQYQKTGNDIPLPVDTLVNFVMEKCKEYDTLVDATGTQPTQSPYTDPVIFTTDEGKTVQVPQYIQQQAIKQWSEDRGNFKRELENYKKVRGASSYTGAVPAEPNPSGNPLGNPLGSPMDNLVGQNNLNGMGDDGGIQELPVTHPAARPTGPAGQSGQSGQSGFPRESSRGLPMEYPHDIPYDYPDSEQSYDYNDSGRYVDYPDYIDDPNNHHTRANSNPIMWFIFAVAAFMLVHYAIKNNIIQINL